MIKYGPHPIIINGSYHDEDERVVDEMVARKFPKFMATEWNRRSAWANRHDFTVDTRPRAKAFEARVLGLLNAISNTKVGRAVLTCMPKDVPVWIVPYDRLNQRVFAKLAAVTALKNVNREEEGVQIMYSPEMWCSTSCGGRAGYRADETLFHELVHAYRQAAVGVAGMKTTPVNLNANYEEFFAFQLETMFASENGQTVLRLHYETSDTGSQDDLETFLHYSADALAALEYFVRFDRLASATLQLKTSTYNPFRDLDRLKQKYAPAVKQPPPAKRRR